ncbi:MAG: Chromosome segregation ATPase [Candidatus Magasanikbacteria bacterium]|nr:Chromosome segregation ATPase [Candidatus Magasanikbacteria bacterium]
MAHLIAVVNQKGGVGKTTTAVNLGAGLADVGKRVLLVDIDPQANASAGLGIDHRALTVGIYDALVGRATLSSILQNTAHNSLRVAPATAALAGANVELVTTPEREWQLERLLKNGTDDFDYVLIDCPPSLGLLTVNGLVAADQVLIPIQTEYYALEGLGQLLDTVRLVQDNLKPSLSILGAVMTMFDGRNKLSKDVFDEVYKFFPNKIFRTVIPRNVRLAEAPSFGKSILHYDSASRGAKAYRDFSREILDFFEPPLEPSAIDTPVATASVVDPADSAIANFTV